MKPSAAPLVEAILAHATSKVDAYYTPGHKNGRALEARFRDGYLTYPFAFDLGFMGHFDDLHAPCGVIAQAEAGAAQLFGADCTYFLTNGSSGGLISLLLATLSPGDEIVLPRNVHRSILYGLILGDFVPRFVDTGHEPDTGLALPLAIESLTEDVLDGVRAIMPVSPTYHGLAADVVTLAARARAKGLWLLVDEAHGAHNIFDSRLPAPALKCGAHAAVQSAHKTLQAFTPGALLHRAADGPDPARLRSALRMMQSSSANYAVLASLDATVAYMQKEGRQRLSQVIDALFVLRRRLNATGLVKALDPERLRPRGVKAIDPTKLVLDFREIGLTGYSAADSLYREAGIAVELASETVVLLIVTAADTDADLAHLGDQLVAFAQARPAQRAVRDNVRPGLPAIAGARAISPRAAFFAQAERVPFDTARGRVAAETIVPYPPGVAAIWPGEILDGDLREFRYSVKNSGASIQSSDPHLESLLVVK